MFRKALFLALPLLLLAPSAGRAGLYTPSDCGDDLLPQVLNVGLPYARDLLDIRYEAVQKSARELFEGLYQAHSPCGSSQRLQVNLAIGNDYQILDWLGRGLVDIAVVPTLSVYLLQKDGVELRELPPEGKVGDFLLPSWEPWLRSREAAGGTWRERDDPEADFGAFRQALWCDLFKDQPEKLSKAEGSRCASLSRAGYRMVLPSHLSTAGFLAPVSVVNTWLEGRLASLDPGLEGEKTRLREDFWKAFFQDTRFTLGEDERDAGVEAAGLIEVRADIGGPPARGVPLGPASRDHLVIAGRAANAIFQKGRFPAPQAGLPEDLRAVLEAEPPPRAFASLLEVEPYFGVRTFGFTVEETIGLLRQHQRTSRRSRLALLLPGGGVKAAYQSRLVDELYRQRYLKNVLTKGEDGGRPPLDVDFVVGTSGGALIGYFVARLAENGPWNLSKVLWEKKEDGVDRVLDSTDIFGWLDLPRYVSVLMIFLTFAALLTIVSTPHRPWLRTELPPERGAWRLRLVLTLWPLLLLVPVLVRVVNGRSSQEHIPEIEGLFYAICASIVLFADQCLILRTGEEKKGERPPVPPLLLALPGAALVAIPLLPVWGPEGERWTDRTLSVAAVHWGAFLVCLGCLCLLGAAVLWISAARRYRLEGVRAFWSGFSLSLFHVFGVYVVLILAMALRPGLISPLELTGGFWAWLLPIALALGVLLVWLGCTGKGGRAGRSVHKGLKFLCSHHPNGSLVSRRFLRISVVLVVCLGWWNFILAPGVYGNKHARAFLEGAVARFEEEHRKENPRGNPHRLTAQLLVPANVLQRDGTRYFLVVPEDLPECPSIAREPGSGASWYQYRLRAGGRRPAAPESCPGVVGVEPADVGRVVFASGSPFPVFPAHFVPVQGVEGQPKEEALVDGGYTSNIPVDAARTIAAEQVLIVESQNPLGHGVSEAAAGAGFGLPGPGPLLAGLFQLPGFLFERSQQVDRLSKRNLFVVSLSPSREESDWPFLVDFRQSTVERMRQVAEADLSRRIGLVESWGPPRFQLSVLVGGGEG